MRGWYRGGTTSLLQPSPRSLCIPFWGIGTPSGRARQGATTFSPRVRAKPRDPPEPIWPLSPGRLGMGLKMSFGYFQISCMKDEGQLRYTEDGGWALVGLRPKAAGVFDQVQGHWDKKYTYQWTKANHQPYTTGLLKPDHLEKSNVVSRHIRAGQMMVGPEGVVRPKGQDCAGEDGRKCRQSPSSSTPAGPRNGG